MVDTPNSATTPFPIPPGSRVLVTGATGFTGRLLTRKLVEGGARVTALARASSNTEPLRDLDIRWVRGDIFDATTVQDAAGDAEFVFNLATPYRQGGSSKDNFRQVHIVGTQLLAECAARNPRFKRFVHVSTVGVHGHVPDGPANEEAPFAPGDPYQESKLEAELWIRDFGRTRGIPVAVIRPAAIYGPGDRRLLKLFRMASQGYVIVFGGGRLYYHLVHVEDLTNVLLLAATHPAAAGEVFICGNPDCTTIPEIARIIGAALDHRVFVLRLPVGPLFVAADLCEWICRRLQVEPPLHRRRVAFFTKDRLFDTRKLRERLGYTMTFTAQHGLTETAYWYRRRGWL